VGRVTLRIEKLSQKDICFIEGIVANLSVLVGSYLPINREAVSGAFFSLR
jgi:hypothetical protein